MTFVRSIRHNMALLLLLLLRHSLLNPLLLRLLHLLLTLRFHQLPRAKAPTTCPFEKISFLDNKRSQASD